MIPLFENIADMDAAENMRSLLRLQCRVADAGAGR